mgnify:CR=1 FL=1
MLQKSLFCEETTDASVTEIVERVEKGQTEMMMNMLGDEVASTGSATAAGEAARDREGEDNGASTGSATETGEAVRNRESGTRQERKKQWPYGLKNDKD